jgi:hypothetical protein
MIAQASKIAGKFERIGGTSRYIFFRGDNVVKLHACQDT